MAVTIHTKNLSIDAAGLTNAAQGDGSNGYVYYGHFLYYLVQVLKALGATVTYSSTRTSGTGISANGRANSDQWDGAYRTAYGRSQIAWSMPTVRGVTRHYIAQLGDYGATNTWRLKMNTSTAYTTSGGGSATQVPAVAGEHLVFGYGTDASPAFDVFQPQGGSYYFHGIYESTLGGVVCAMYPSVGGTTSALGAFFAIDPLRDGTYESGDDDVVTVSTLGKTPELSDFADATLGRARMIAQKGLGGAAMKPFVANAKGTVPGSAASSTRTGRKLCAQIAWQRDASPACPGGLSSMLQWYGPVGTVPNRLKLYSLKTPAATPVEKLLLGQVLIDWDGSVPS